MENLKFNNVCKLLPFTDAEREGLLAKYAGLDEVHKLEFQKELWSLFNEYKAKLVELEYSVLLAETVTGQSKLTGDLDRQARSRVWAYFEDILAGKTDERKQIDDIRGKLKTLAN